MTTESSLITNGQSTFAPLTTEVYAQACSWFPEIMRDYQNLNIFSSSTKEADYWKFARHIQFNNALMRPQHVVDDAGYYGDGTCATLETSNDANLECWLRITEGASQVPYNATKIVGMMHVSLASWFAYTPFRAVFNVDLQLGVDARRATGLRRWWKIAHVVTTAGTGGPYEHKWQYDAITTDGTPTWVDIPLSANLPLSSYNEPPKHMWGWVGFVFNIKTGNYEALYINGFKIDLQPLLTNNDVILPDYQNGTNIFNTLNNRNSTTTQQSKMMMQNLIYGYQY